ncbi:YheC/YheD family endospore coat-associated protein [Paenibacillus eucommiae]|uniref:YheC/YheD family protein n=1 Tax=Paenibacillus eucommiae TaxID=1355755 RepID=A0ABS4IQD0_9BACL|nr:YheC/YheD family protein [Paenibacillus eucommiae]MBP1989111.1 hypothetical protein [Paenibacillus eucommiae]
MTKPIIGILVYRKGYHFFEPRYFRDLIREGTALGAQVFLFSYRDFDEHRRQVVGYIPAGNTTWQSKIFPWPDVVIDRTRKLEPAFRAMRRRKNLFIYANHKFTCKSRATKRFEQDETVKRWIPQTMSYTANNLRTMLSKHRLLYVKPSNGTGGQGVLKITKGPTGYNLLARERGTKLRQFNVSSESALVSTLQNWTKTQRVRSGSFMLQQGIDTELIPNRVVDARVLVQKDGSGAWKLTGIAFRVGGKYSPTTNLLYGDGKALRCRPFLRKRFGEQKANQIIEECTTMAKGIVASIEKHHGSMLEFGLDVGIDVQGRVWLLEANPKPSRDVFLKTGENEVYKKSLQRPIQYAMYIAQKKNKRIDHQGHRGTAPNTKTLPDDHAPNDTNNRNQLDENR